MKTLKDIITERLHITKNSKVFNEEYSFNEFKDLLSNELNTIVVDKTFKLMKRYANLTDLQFIDITNDNKEHTYYIDEILNVIDDVEFTKDYYLLSDGTEGIFFHYLNIDVKPDTMINQMRYGYITNKDRHDISNTHIFKIKIKE